MVPGQRQIAALLITIALSGCHLVFPFDRGAVDAGVASDARPDAAPADQAGNDLPGPSDTDTIQPSDTGLSTDTPASPDNGSGCQHPPVVDLCANGWCPIPAGCFTMGSPTSEPCRNTDETQHQVTLTRKFEIAQTEVTQSAYQGKMGSNPSTYDTCGGDCPVENLTWHDAVKYCNTLSDEAGLDTCYSCSTGNDCTPAYSNIYDCPGYRLPTEAEWEYAARAGTTTAFYSGPFGTGNCTNTNANADVIGWYFNNSTKTPHPVGGKQANDWGLFDMSGNVWEWTHDWYAVFGSAPQTDPLGAPSGTDKVLKGGSFFSWAYPLRSAERYDGMLPETSNYQTGFRCARTL